jgi:predicted ATPase
VNCSRRTARDDIICEFQPLGGGPRLDISSAGSGMQQVLMLLAFLHMRPASVLLLDEPDAHLHVYLQDSIYELRSVAARRNSQLIIATHSEGHYQFGSAGRTMSGLRSAAAVG